MGRQIGSGRDITVEIATIDRGDAGTIGLLVSTDKRASAVEYDVAGEMVGPIRDVDSLDIIEFLKNPIVHEWFDNGAAFLKFPLRQSRNFKTVKKTKSVFETLNDLGKLKASNPTDGRASDMSGHGGAGIRPA